MELENPAVDGDELVGRSVENERVGGAITQTFVPTDSVPVADILMLEVKKFSMGRTIGLFGLVFVAAPVFLVLVVCAIEGFDHCGPSG
jgi:energy-converting hydrogenase Eha subunit B